jgi:hypothetical protein
MMRLFLSLFMVLAICNVILAEDSIPAPVPAIPDSLSLSVFPVTAQAADSLKLQTGDSVFIFAGEQYFRARSGGREFFVSGKTLLSHADSLVIYQFARLGGNIQAASPGDSILAKPVRQQCAMITKNGTRCKRLAEPGSDKCWQHKRK